MVQSEVIVIDGGFATQLTVHVGKSVDGDPLWSARWVEQHNRIESPNFILKIIDPRFNATNPDAVIKTHLDFLEAGAEAIITNTYQASVEGYNQYLNYDDEQSIKLIKDTVQLAHVARSLYLKREDVVKPIPWILGSIVSNCWAVGIWISGETLGCVLLGKCSSVLSECYH